MEVGSIETSERHAKIEAFALLPSLGRGGGIERYVGAVLEALEASDVVVSTVAVLGAGEPAVGAAIKGRFVLRTLRRVPELRRCPRVLLLVSHSSLVPVAILTRRLIGARCDAKLFLYGTDVWSISKVNRALIRLWRPELIAISSFTAGAAMGLGSARVLRPSIGPAWYGLLRSSAERRSGPRRPLRILSVFRLDDAWRKGADLIVRAAMDLCDEGLDLAVTMAGHGPAASWLTAAAAECPDRLSIVQDPDDVALASLYHNASVVVLATRTAVEGATGEGFGMTLVEAQLAGAPVIGPAHGGITEAFLPGVTGLQLADETAGSLRQVLRWCIDNPRELAALGMNGYAWASEVFHPKHSLRQVRTALLGADSVGSFDLRIQFQTPATDGTVS